MRRTRRSPRGRRADPPAPCGSFRGQSRNALIDERVPTDAAGRRQLVARTSNVWRSPHTSRRLPLVWGSGPLGIGGGFLALADASGGHWWRLLIPPQQSRRGRYAPCASVTGNPGVTPRSGPLPSRLWGSVIRGRDDERATLNELLERARAGRSGVLALRGAPGIGKSALLEYVVSVAPDMSVLSAAGIESEMELPFAGLHQLCAPLLGDLSRLPAPQRAALQTIFGLSDGPAPDRLLVGLSVLSLLADAAEKQPILCTVDDAQWLDEASALAFSFVARRLLAEPIVMLFATREISSATAGSPELLVDGLPTPMPAHCSRRRYLACSTRGSPSRSSLKRAAIH